MIFSSPTKAPPQMNRMFVVSTGVNSWCGCLRAALRRNVGDRAFQNLQQGLLHAFARNVAGDGRVFVLLRNLVDLVDIYDALLRLLDVSIGGLQEFQNNIFYVLTDVAGFGERRGIHNREGHIQHARQSLRQKCFAGTRRADQQNIGFREFDVPGLPIQEDAFVVVVNRDGELLLGFILADDVAIEKRLDLRRAGQALVRRVWPARAFRPREFAGRRRRTRCRCRSADTPKES